MSVKTPKILVITGPTATGKSALGIAMAKEHKGEIVSADSMQVYKGLDIGTAKITFQEMQGVPHHMLDIADPQEAYSVARYVQDASACVDDILSRGKLPILVGGTGLYIDSLISGRDFAGGEPSQQMRDQLNEKYKTLGGEALLRELGEIDPRRAEKLHPSDSKRIIRALEVFYTTGKTISQHDLETKRIPPRYDACMIALAFKDRQKLYERIDRRVDKMLDEGLVQEVKNLLNVGLAPKSTAMQAIGYKEICAYLEGKTSLLAAVELIKQESRRYAKRQMTWLRRNPAVDWILLDEADVRLRSTEFFLSHGLK